MVPSNTDTTFFGVSSLHFLPNLLYRISSTYTSFKDSPPPSRRRHDLINFHFAKNVSPFFLLSFWVQKFRKVKVSVKFSISFWSLETFSTRYEISSQVDTFSPLTSCRSSINHIFFRPPYHDSFISFTDFTYLLHIAFPLVIHV